MTSPQTQEAPALDGPFTIIKNSVPQTQMYGECGPVFTTQEADDIRRSRVFQHLGETTSTGACMVILQRSTNRVTGSGVNERQGLQVSYAAVIAEDDRVLFVDRFYDDDHVHGATPRQMRALGAPAVRSNILATEVPALPLHESVIPQLAQVLPFPEARLRVVS